MIQLQGSVFPHAFRVSVPCGLLSAFLKYMDQRGEFSSFGGMQVISSTGAFSGFTFLVGFLIVFRTSQAYARFWSAVFDTHQMCAQWFDAASSTVAFCRPSRTNSNEVTAFLHTLIRLFSMLTAVALQDLSDDDSVRFLGYESLDPGGLDRQTIATLHESGCRVELVYQWIIQLIVDNIATGVVAVPPPIATRAFQQLASGMVSFHDAMKVAWIPFPFPYAQTTVALLLIHWIVTPVIMVAWTSSPPIAAIFSAIPVFTLWSMNSIATEIEQPFSGQANDIDPSELQARMNTRLLMLLDPSTVAVPSISHTRNDPETLLKKLLSERATVHELALEIRGASAFLNLKSKSQGGDSAPQSSKSWGFMTVSHLDKRDSQKGPQVNVGSSRGLASFKAVAAGVSKEPKSSSSSSPVSAEGENLVRPLGIVPDAHTVDIDSRISSPDTHAEVQSPCRGVPDTPAAQDVPRLRNSWGQEAVLLPERLPEAATSQWAPGPTEWTTLSNGVGAIRSESPKLHKGQPESEGGTTASS